MDSLINYLDKYHSQLTVLLLGLSLIVLAVFVWVWFFNRRKYQHLKHQIPASVVKNYLDSIIQNSTALKSSLFRGGGLDVDANGIPSVLPLADLPAGTQAKAADLTMDDSAARAQLANIQALLKEKENIIKDLENKIDQLNGEARTKDERIKELERLLAEAQASGNQGSGSGDSSKLQEELKAAIQERDELRDELKQFEIISDDLADLKRLKQENALLKKSLEAAGGSVAEVESQVQEASPSTESEAAPAELDEDQVESQEQDQSEDGEEPEQEQEAPVSESDDSDTSPEEESEEVENSKEELDDSAQDDQESSEEASMQSEQDDSSESEDSNDEDKSPEDLLSEFEKMLG